MSIQRVLVVGGGVAGLSAAVELADLSIAVEIVERSPFLGGHAVSYACKATEQCVKCGACIVEEKLDRAIRHPKITVHTGTRMEECGGDASGRFNVSLRRQPLFIDPERCTDCGACFDVCPVEGAMARGVSRNQKPVFTISADNCLNVRDGSCTRCRDACPENAIDLDAQESSERVEADAVVMATGFAPYHPVDKPYGYGTFENVITSLEMERMLGRHCRAIRPSDGRDAGKIAFIQCVGSRDAKRNHLWCSKICCGSALRMAGLVKARQPDTFVTFFYMDVQTFGRDFGTFYPDIREKVQMIRAIPGDVYPAEADALRVTFLDNASSETRQEDFDLLVLSVGMVPGEGTARCAEALDLPVPEHGFFDPSALPACKGIFSAGTVNGPMSIPETVASASKAAWEVVRYLAG